MLLTGSLLALVPFLALAGTLFLPDATGIDPAGYYFGRDFVNYWTAARLAIEGTPGVLYDPRAYILLLKQWFHPSQPDMLFSYFPNILPVLAPLGLFPYGIALPLCWSLGAIAFLAATFGGIPQRDDNLLVAVFLVSPVLLVNLIFGQLGLFLAAIFVGALRLLPVRPMLAGILIGLLTVKPQLGVLLPLTLILRRDWQAFMAATVTALLLAGFSVALYGVEPWQNYALNVLPHQWRFTTELNGFFRLQLVTPFAATRMLGASSHVAWYVQGFVTCAVIAATVLVVRSEARWPLKAVSIATGTMLAVPYGLAYDLAIPAAALLWYLADCKSKPSAAGARAVALIWIFPCAAGIYVQTLGIPILPAAVAFLYVCLVGEALLPRGYVRLTEGKHADRAALATRPVVVSTQTA